MNLLLGLGSSLFSNPLVKGVLGDLAGGAIKTLKNTAATLLGDALGTATNYGNQALQQVTRYGNRAIRQVEEWDPVVEYSKPRPRAPVKKRPRPRPVYNADEYDYEPPPKRRRTNKPVYDPDIEVTDFEPS